MNRRGFVKLLGTAAVGTILTRSLIACGRKNPIHVTIVGADFKRGHSVRQVQKPTHFQQTIQVKNIIVGGGISGLSTAYHLNELGEKDFLLLEMNAEIGGNSSALKTPYSWAPKGAHYLSLPNEDNFPMIAFMQKHKLITGVEEGKYVYNESQLCHAPNERLLYRGQFQEGLVPEYGLSEKSMEEIEQFFSWMRSLKLVVDKNGKQQFNVPVSRGAFEMHIEDLDKITFSAFLKEKKVTNSELLWFLDYCCRDDFGAGMDKVSAWAGVHYFAARKANPFNADPTSVLTWPEGNFHLSKLLANSVQDKIVKDEVVHEIIETAENVVVHAYNPIKKTWTKYIAEKAVAACPSYVSKHVLKSENWPATFFDGFTHFPWFIGIVTVKKLPKTKNGVPLAWDNVKYGTKGLGYVSNRHQELSKMEGPLVLSVYLTLDEMEAAEGRKHLFSMDEAEMLKRVIDELKGIHPEIEEEILSVDIQRWGHGMITPVPGALKKQLAFKELTAKSKRVFLAHTDYASYSIFEEGFDAGFQAANNLIGVSIEKLKA